MHYNGSLQIHRSIVTRVVFHWIDIMYDKLKPYVFWVDRITPYETLSWTFKKKFNWKAAIIVHCFEVFRENQELFPELWKSNKILIGITLTGSVTFISNVWDGKVSDRYIMENCGILEKLIVGDVLITSNGKNDDDPEGFSCAEVIVPAYQDGKKQLAEMKSIDVPKIRVHINQILSGFKKQYPVLEGVVPVSFCTKKEGEMPAIEKVALVCCALSNIGNSHSVVQ